jgi:phosphoribosylamine--glycine ligase
MDILVVGSGGREHALCWKIRQSPLVGRLWVAPGNAGIAQCSMCVPLAADDMPGIVQFAVSHGVDLVVIGPEDPLTKGLADELRAAGVRVVGPGAKGAQLEGSKAFAKEFCRHHGIPTARAVVCATAREAEEHLGDLGLPVVVKADGLAAGKGVIVAANREEAQAAVRRLGRTGGLLLEEFLRGRECSLLYLCDGHRMIPLAPARDYKRVDDGDRGPNTGGMGAFSPLPDVGLAVQEEAYARIVQLVLAGLADEHIDYRGILYAGCMLTEEGIKVLEFNCRFGDPETQVLMPRIDGDLVPALAACADGRLEDVRIAWHSEAAVCVQMVSRGYPGVPETGMMIAGLEDVPDDVTVFHGGTRQENGRILTAGGRVLGVTACGETLAQARERAYVGLQAIRFEGAHWRTDIASAWGVTGEEEQR